MTSNIEKIKLPESKKMDVENKSLKQIIANYKNPKDVPNNLRELEEHLATINKNRKLRKLPELDSIICYICGKRNNHLTADCENAICKICYDHHITRKCKLLRCCQICNGNHNTRICPDQDGVKIRLLRYVRCHFCNKYGHTATMCFSRIRRRNFSSWNYKRKYYTKNNFRNFKRNYSYSFRRRFNRY